MQDDVKQVEGPPSGTHPDVPREALVWYYTNGVTSYVDLARMSNVSTRWRKLLLELLQQEDRSSRGGSPPFLYPSTGQPGSSSKSVSDAAADSMTENITARQGFRSCCLAWFPPEQIQMVQVAKRDHHRNSRRDEDEDEASSIHYLCKEWRGYRTFYQVLRHFGFTRQFVNQAFAHCPEDNPSIAAVTSAVRGATVARAESYCFCVEVEDSLEETARTVSAGSHSGASAMRTTRASSARTEQERIRMEHQQLAALQTKARIRELQLDVLPRVMVRSRSGKACLQFLNGPGSHAVCMMTPRFATGSIPEPVTILLVGMASEDGCFVSGLRERFELGYLYPSDRLSEITERSSICLATDIIPAKNNDPSTSFSGSQSDAQAQSLDTSLSMHDDSEDGSDQQFEEEKCHCVFDGITNKYDEMDENDKRLHRGLIGPGQWHCFVAVFDGLNSVIRVDGLEEPMHNRPFALENFKKATLDGLTIGSDHCFGMSLCSGQGSSDMEGAIAELAVFEGRLDEQDIRVLEAKMMSKHRIPLGEISRWREHLWIKQADAVLTHSARLNATIPLRYLARNPKVAWELHHPITEQSITIQRIGSRPGGSSSEW